MLLFIVLLGGIGFMYLSPQFEQNKPKVSFLSNKYWNLKNKIKIKIEDESGIKYYKILFLDGNNKIVLEEKILNSNFLKSKIVELNPPKLDIFYKGNDVKIKVIAIDNSKWNFLNGNKSSNIFDIKIDKQNPTANVLRNSRYIKRGGSAVVTVQIEDENLAKAYIVFNNKIKFILTPFYKDNYYVSLIAWPVNIKKFNRIKLVAIDKAKNKTVVKVPIYIQKMKIKNDIIKISEKFITNVSMNVLKKSKLDIPNNLIDTFLKQNDHLRSKNVAFLRDLGQNKMDYTKQDSLKINYFKRLRGSLTVAVFAEKRSYIYNNKKIDEQWHLGMDWAKVKHTTIKSSNDGKVIFNDYLGIYGDTIIIDHGLGLASLYAHTNNTYVQEGQTVYKNTKLATTGTSGAVLGDHLHFGILIQGIEVDPIEWMDRRWIKSRISNILKQTIKDIN
jgi:murein DD-endopeptidase MepM/ murein hydrolase activator NlpD